MALADRSERAAAVSDGVSSSLCWAVPRRNAVPVVCRNQIYLFNLLVYGCRLFVLINFALPESLIVFFAFCRGEYVMIGAWQR